MNIVKSSATDNSDFSPEIYSGLLLEKPMYAKIAAPDSLRYGGVDPITRPNFALDMHCVNCGKIRTFKFADFHAKTPIDTTKPFSFTLIYECGHSRDHRSHFSLRLDGKVLEKIGQWPNAARLASSKLKHYKEVLDEHQYADLTQGLHLEAHGVGAGALIYYRRVLEGLVEEAHQSALKTTKWKESRYKRLSVEERIGMLKAHLPDFLVEHAWVYGLMSKGIHALPENQCREISPIARAGLECMLSQKIELLAREKARETTSVHLHALKTMLGRQKAKPTE